jgi:tol-pal system protein YbgF
LAATFLSLDVVAPSSLAQERDSVATRVGQLEAQIADLKVMIGTLESLLRSKPGATLRQEADASTGDSGAAIDQGSLGPRVEALETQIGALTSQLETIGKQMSALEAKLSASPQPMTPLPQEVPAPERQGQAPASESEWAAVDTSKARWFGPRPGQDSSPPGDDAGPKSLLPQGDAALVGSIPGQPESQVAALPGSSARALFDEGQGELLQRDYAAAESAFRKLVEAYPDDPLAGGAQYWLGETYYARGQYKNAADAFLTGYKKYKSGDKAPDTLLRLGMALAELGQKDAACSTFGELGARFPKAPEHVLDQAKAERKKTGC